MLFSRRAFTSSTAIAASSALFASTFLAAATSPAKASSSAASTKNEAVNVDAGILALSPSSSRVGENRLHGIFVEERALQGLCSAGYVECVNGYLATDIKISCSKACLNNGSGKHDCCDGPLACAHFTGKICKDGSCNGPSACEYATIPLVVDSCQGYYACNVVAWFDATGGDPPAKVGNFIGSCNASEACRGIAKYGGGAGNIENSCNAYAACKNLGQINPYGPVTSNLKDCCKFVKSCVRFAESDIPAECKVTEAPTPAPTETPTSAPTPAPSPASATLGPKAGKNKKAGKASKPTPAPTVSTAPTDSAAPSNAKSGKNKKAKTASLFE